MSQWRHVCDRLGKRVAPCLQIYRACEIRGRIAYKRSGGSRLITQNDHWKSQIRHALYTSERFVRCAFARSIMSCDLLHTAPGLMSGMCVKVTVADSVAQPSSDHCRYAVYQNLASIVQSFRGCRLLDGVQELHKASSRNDYRASAHKRGGYSCHRRGSPRSWSTKGPPPSHALQACPG